MSRILVTIQECLDQSNKIKQNVLLYVFFVSYTFDYETTKELTGIILIAEDGGQSPRYSKASDVTIKIRNVNDNEPEFIQEIFGK